jgi:hypothetical protein
VSYLDGLIRYALSLGADCQLESPAEAKARHRETGLKIFDAHKPLARRGVA